ncbi:hypothetical protein HDE69_003393 [Pedobacter cryoconitis]|uniref:Uncharacterized protein n=1 Tax=Pedobacter cryoconitis TaxID=188932 RepID=A0A7W8YVE2_9SPHI|nr:hypothetical protein [Pedobacter cryoconitis]
MDAFRIIKVYFTSNLNYGYMRITYYKKDPNRFILASS